MNRFILILLTASLLLSCNNENPLPNIVIIFADDMGYGDPGCYNSESKIATPSIDRLAENGMCFSNAHAPAAWCTPSRYGLLTGKYPARTNISMAGIECLIKPDQINLASMLKAKGYYTACIGKWHLGFDSVNYKTRIDGGPVDRGFDYYFGIPVSLDIPPYYYIENNQCVEAPTDSIAASNTPGVSFVQGEFWRKGGIAPSFKHVEVLPDLTDKAIEVIQNHHQNDPGRPFFLYFPLPGPHTPWLPTEAFQGESQAGMYGDFVMEVDHTVSQIMTTLEDLSITDNTLVIFSSDNGPVWFDEDIANYGHRSSHYLKGIKSDMWEGGHRMPFIVQWPATIKAGTWSNELIGFTDVLATFGDITKSDLSDYILDSHSFLPVLKGKTQKSPIREEMLIDKKALITHEWKFIDGHGGDGFNRAYSLSRERFLDLPRNKGELYHIASDSAEQHNLYSSKPELVEKLSKRLDSIKFSHKPIVSIEGEKFMVNGEYTYPGRSWNGFLVEGLLMNARLVQGIFDDSNPETVEGFKYPDTGIWDPDRNTREFVGAMPSWKEHGLLSFTLNMQGGSPLGYGNKGWINTAYFPDGRLKKDYLRRLQSILDKAVELDMVVILGYFYFGQDQHLTDEHAVITAVDNITDWLLENGYQNVLVEINNECNVNYDHEILQPERVHELIQRIAKKQVNGRKLLVSTSYGGGTLPKPNVVSASDFILLHGNGISDPARIAKLVESTRQVDGYTPKPILFNEDDHFNFENPSNNFVEAVKSYASWGYFDFRMKDEGFEYGFQSVPVDWQISSPRKQRFFNKLKEITGS